MVKVALLVALALTVLVSLPRPALAFNEPDTFRGIPWGATVEEAKDILGKARAPHASDLPDGVPSCPGDGKACLQKGKLGPVNVSFFYLFKDNKFSSAIITFKVADYDAVRTILDERYGPPTTRKQDTVQTKVGVSHLQETSTWSGVRVTILLRRFAKTVEEGNAHIFLRSVAEEHHAERNKALKKGKADL